MYTFLKKKEKTVKSILDYARSRHNVEGTTIDRSIDRTNDRSNDRDDDDEDAQS